MNLAISSPVRVTLRLVMNGSNMAAPSCERRYSAPLMSLVDWEFFSKSLTPDDTT